MKLYLTCILLFANHISFAINTYNSGVRDINYNLAYATLNNIITHLLYAEKVVVNDIMTLRILPAYTQQSTNVYAYLINNTGNTWTSTNWITTRTSTNSGSYTKNPYIYKLAILQYRLQIQMQFVSNFITSTSGYATSQLRIFEPFLGRRIVLVPHMENSSDVSGQNTTVTGNGIDYWNCYTDADETVASSANGIKEGNFSIASIIGGVLDQCMFVSAANLNSLWISI